MRELYMLGGIQSTEKPILTEIGQQMAAFPLDPRFTKLILASKEFGCTLVNHSFLLFNHRSNLIIFFFLQRRDSEHCVLIIC